MPVEFVVQLLIDFDVVRLAVDLIVRVISAMLAHRSGGAMLSGCGLSHHRCRRQQQSVCRRVRLQAIQNILDIHWLITGTCARVRRKTSASIVEIQVVRIGARVTAFLEQTTIAILGIIFTRIAATYFYIARITADMLTFLDNFWLVISVSIIAVEISV